jgi:hypothetical protein
MVMTGEINEDEKIWGSSEMVDLLLQVNFFLISLYFLLSFFII